jgi:hypothetical protein
VCALDRCMYGCCRKTPLEGTPLMRLPNIQMFNNGNLSLRSEVITSIINTLDHIYEKTYIILNPR